MINQISVEGYKCFDKFTVDTPSLVVLTGVNGVGKSAFIQSILLGWESGQSNNQKQIIPLNGDMFNLGSVDEVIPHASNCPHIISISWQMSNFSEVFNCQLRATDREDRFLSLVSNNDMSEKNSNPIWEGLGGFTYLSADRSGPSHYSKRQSNNKGHLTFGRKGEFCADIIALHNFTPVQNDGITLKSFNNLEYPSSYSKQIEAWMHYLGFGLQLRSESAPISDITILEYFDERDSEWISPVHTGFGITYSLPIIAAGLMAKQGGVLVVDSPEAHLHPSAQSRIGKFLARLAATGVQVLVETHSDHIINGIRLAAIDENIKKDDILFIAFDKTETGLLVKDEIRIMSNNSLSSWPRGFFDQIQSDLAEIASRKIF